jgi:hypothetical protein
MALSKRELALEIGNTVSSLYTTMCYEERKQIAASVHIEGDTDTILDFLEEVCSNFNDDIGSSHYSLSVDHIEKSLYTLTLELTEPDISFRSFRIDGDENVCDSFKRDDE